MSEDYKQMNPIEQRLFMDKLLTVGRAENFFLKCKNLIKEAEQSGVFKRISYPVEQTQGMQQLPQS